MSTVVDKSLLSIALKSRKAGGDPESRWLKQSEVLKRPHWTRTMVRNLLGGPDVIGHHSRGEVFYFRPERVLGVETSAEFVHHVKKLLARAEALRDLEPLRTSRRADKAVRETDKRNRIGRRQIEEIGRRSVSVPRCPMAYVRAKAIAAYNLFHEHSFHNADEAHNGSDECFLDRISVNYLRHKLTPYDDWIREAGSHSVAVAIKCRMLDSIAAVYPELAEECEDQREMAEALPDPEILENNHPD